MRNRIERLRLWLLAGAGLLVLVLVAFVASARYLRRHVLAGLPQKLGLNIKSMSDGPVSYSHSVGHTTVYTIHASRQVEYTDGKIVLRDVDMTLFGQKGDRSDRIYGKEFEYDQNSGVVRAIGLVHIDLKASNAGVTPTKDAEAHAVPKINKTTANARKGNASQDRIVHATTSGLVYMDKLGVAATSEPIEFQLGSITGHAVGADYNTDSGMLMLHSAVNMTGVQGGRPLTVTASAAELNHRDHRAFLTHARYVSQGETVDADQTTLHTRADGTLARIEAQGNVTSQAKGATLVSSHADVVLGAQSQPQSALLTGGVNYSVDELLRQVRGRADSMNVAFDAQAKPQPQHAIFTGSVHMTEKIRSTIAANEPWSTRDLTASKVEAALVPAADDKVQLQDVVATGNAHLALVDNAKAMASARTDLSGDELKAHLIATTATRQPQLDTLDARGHAVLHQAVVGGLDQTSTSDSLDARFRPGAISGTKTSAAAAARKPGLDATSTLLSVLQQGHVTILRRIPPKPNAKPGSSASREDIQHAVAERAAYDADTDRVTLTGSVQMKDQGSMLWSNQVTLDHTTGDARAEGSVKVIYSQDRPTTSSQRPDPEPAHILADHADLNRDTDIATFYGEPVRLWQGGSQVQAPVIELDRAQSRMVARSESADGPAVVHTILASVGGASSLKSSAVPKTSNPAQSKPPALKAISKTTALAHSAQTARITSREVTYSRNSSQAEFTGGVRVETGDAIMLAREATAYFQPAAKPSSETPLPAVPPDSNLSLERVVATGPIDLSQPGRRAIGDRLIYTAADELYVLSGRPGALPKVVDTIGGTTVTGTVLRFHAGDESVEALSTAPGETALGKRVRTDARISDESKPTSAKH